MPRTFFPLTILGRQGHKISGIVGISSLFCQQQNTEGARPLTIILHGLRDHKNSETISGIEKEIPPQFDTFRFDFSGNGDSEGETSYSDYPFQIEDLEIVIQFLESHRFSITSLDQPWLEPFLKTKERSTNCARNSCFTFSLKALLGHSKGGTVSMLFASKKSCKIPYIINISGRKDLREKSMHRFKGEQIQSINKGEKIVWRTFTDSTDQKRPIWISAYDFTWRDEFNPDIFKTISHNHSIKAVLTIHGSDDNVVPLEDAIAFDGCFQKDSIHTLKVLNGFSHMFLREGEMKELTYVINNWLLDQNLVSHL